MPIFCQKLFESVPIEGNLRNQQTFRRVVNIPWIILQREISNALEYCLVPMSKLRNMPRAQYFTLLHFFNELQNIRKESVSSNDALSKPEAIKMTVAVQDILANDNLDSHGEKRKMP